MAISTLIHQYISSKIRSQISIHYIQREEHTDEKDKSVEFLSQIDHNKVAAGVFLDLSKTFDTINHEILFYKLEQ